MTNLAPIIIFGYRRVDTLKKSITSLRLCPQAVQTDLFIFLDAPKSLEEELLVSAVRTYTKTIDGFRSIEIFQSKEHKGLASSVIDGVTEILSKRDRVIVLEDDLVVSNNFLAFMNEALNFYEECLKVFSISGFSFPISCSPSYQYDNYFTQRASSWGWATWKNRWQRIDWEVLDYQNFLSNKKSQKEFNKMGSDLTRMLSRQKSGKTDSWAIRWVYHQYKNQLYSVFPIYSKVRNIGFGSDATHTNQYYNRFDTRLDKSGKTSFQFNPDIHLDVFFVKQFVRRYTISQRAIFKILNLFH